jgi:hypothetical protein
MVIKAALHWAAHGGCVRCVRYLVEAGALVDITDTKGNTPLHSAVSNGYPYIVKYLVERGANVDARSVYLGAPLHMAAEPKPQEANLARSCLEAAKLLIKAGCDVNVCDDEGVTPLRMAESRGNELGSRPLPHRRRRSAHDLRRLQVTRQGATLRDRSLVDCRRYGRYLAITGAGRVGRLSA